MVEKQNPKKTVVPTTTGQPLELELNKKQSDYVCKVVFDIPAYNSRFTFVPLIKKSERWVKLVKREWIDSTKPATVDLTDTPFYALAVWACAILHCRRFASDGGSSIDVPVPSKIWWNVYWRADDSDHHLGRYSARTPYLACKAAIAEQGVLSMLDSTFAVPEDDRRSVLVADRNRSAKPIPPAPVPTPASSPVGEQLSISCGA